MAPTQRPRSLDELRELSRPNTYDPERSFKDQLRAIDALRNQSIHHKEKDDLENAYIYMAQATAIMLDKLPYHSQYDTVLSSKQKSDLASNGKNMQKLLDELKPQIEERYRKYQEGLANGIIPHLRKRREEKSRLRSPPEERTQYPRTPNSIGEKSSRAQPISRSTPGLIVPISDSQEGEMGETERTSRSRSRDPRSSASEHLIPTPSPTPSREPPSELGIRSHHFNRPMDDGYRRESSDEEVRRDDLREALGRMQRKFDADLEACLMNPAPLPEAARLRQALEVVESTGIEERGWIEEKDRRLNGSHRSATCERELQDQATLQGEREAHVRKLFFDRARRIEARERDAKIGRQRQEQAAQEVHARIARETQRRAEKKAEEQAKAGATARMEARAQVEEREQKERQLQAQIAREKEELRIRREISNGYRQSSIDQLQHPLPSMQRPPGPAPTNPTLPSGGSKSTDRILRRVESQASTSAPLHQPPVSGIPAPIVPNVPNPTPGVPIIPSSYPATPTGGQVAPPSRDHSDSRTNGALLKIPHPTDLHLGPGTLSLESPTRSRGHLQGPVEDPRNPNREARHRSYPSPITTTSPAPRELLPFLNQTIPPNLMSSHQRFQGYAPSPDSMFAQQDGTPNALLFQPIGVTEVPTRPDPHLGVTPWPNKAPQSRGPSPRPLLPSIRSSPYPDMRAGPPLSNSSHYSSGPNHSRQNSFVPLGQLRKVVLPKSALSRFLSIAALNTTQKRETCGLLLGRFRAPVFEISTLLIPKQIGTEDTCTMVNEELVAEVQEKRGLITIGWIHTHPTQSCFMSSLDLHTHSGYQSSLPEAVAIVCAPNHTPNFGIFRLTDPPGLGIVRSCAQKSSFHPHSDSQPIYTDADSDHVQMIEEADLEIIDIR